MADDHLLRGPPSEYLTVEQTADWIDVPITLLEELADEEWIPPPQDFGYRTKKYHWEVAVAIKVFINCRWLPRKSAPPKPDLG